MKKTSLFSLFAAAFALLLTAGAAKAEMLTLKVSGVLGGSTLLDSIAIGVDTPFSFELQFDPSADFFEQITDGLSIYNSHNFLFFFGEDSYSTTQEVKVIVCNPPPGGGLGFYTAGIATSLSNILAGAYAAATPDYTDLAPVPTVFSDYMGVVGGNFSLSLTGLGVLETNDENVEITSTVLEAVPEPSAWAMLGMGVPALLLGAMRLRGRRA